MTDSKRQAIFQKYHGHCAYCGRPLKMKAMTVDHLVPKSKGGLVPKSKGGGNCIENLMPSCSDCNTTKAADNLEMLRISLSWPYLRPSDLQDFARVRKVASGYKFYFETTI